MKAKNINEAWEIVNEIFPSTYERDEQASICAGYSIYRSPIEHYDYICVLGNRLEVNLKNGNRTINIWIESENQQSRPEEKKESQQKIINNLCRLSYFFSREMLNDEQKKQKEKKEFEKLKKHDEIIIYVSCTDNNIRVMKDCLKATNSCIDFVRKQWEDVEP